MICTIHTDREAAGACTYCGKFFCSDCLVDINGRNYCREHVGKAVQEQTATAAAQPNIVINNANSNMNTNNNVGVSNMISPKSRLISLLLCIFLGCFGIHRFYVGKIGTGILYLFTMGFGGFGVLLDIILIICGSFTDKIGFPVKKW